MRRWIPWILFFVLAVLIVWSSRAARADTVNLIRHYDPTHFTDDSEIQPGTIEIRELRCGHASSQWAGALKLPANGLLTTEEVLLELALSTDSTIYCVSRVAVGGISSQFSTELVFFCDRVGTGRPSDRPLVCWRGERIPPGHRGR